MLKCKLVKEISKGIRVIFPLEKVSGVNKIMLCWGKDNHFFKGTSNGYQSRPYRYADALWRSPRWRKKHGGTIYYFRGRYADALKAWEKKKKEIDGSIAMATADTGRERTAHLEGRIREALQTDLAEHWRTGDEQAAQRASAALARLSRKVKDRTPSGPAVLTIGQAVGEYLAEKRTQVAIGRIKGSTLSILTNLLGYFRRWAESRAVEEIDEKFLTEFFAFLASQIEAEKIKRSYAHQILLHCKAFIRKQWQLRRIELPRNLTDRDLSIPVPLADISVLSVEQVRTFYHAAQSWLKPCILLSVNCGFNQADIAALTHSAINWEEGTITKRREKTGRYTSVPTITWKLWPSTLRELQENRSPHASLVLLGKHSQPLVAGYGLERVDAIAASWANLRSKVGITAPYKALRKTSATMLGSNPLYARYAQYFLGHAPSTVADRHYVRPSQEEFNRALDWLGQVFGL